MLQLLSRLQCSSPSSVRIFGPRSSAFSGVRKDITREVDVAITRSSSSSSQEIIMYISVHLPQSLNGIGRCELCYFKLSEQSIASGFERQQAIFMDFHGTQNTGSLTSK